MQGKILNSQRFPSSPEAGRNRGKKETFRHGMCAGGKREEDFKAEVFSFMRPGVKGQKVAGAVGGQ